MTGQANVVLVGGAESMTQAPYAIRNARNGMPLGKPSELEDTLWSSLTDSFTGMPMGMTAEKLAVTHGISQEMVDQYALRSQTLHAEAQKAGRFATELVPVDVKKGKETVQLSSLNKILRGINIKVNLASPIDKSL